MTILLASGLSANASDRTGCVVGIDHIPLAVKDLDSASLTYKRLGFAIKLGRLHQNGIHNQHVKFEDGAEIELITAQRGVDALSADYVRLLAQGEGPAFLSFHTPDMPALKGKLSAGGYAFNDDDGFLTLSDPRLRFVFFFEGNNKSPTDRPEHFQHANTARAMIGVWIADSEDSPLIPLLGSLGAEIVRTKVFAPVETTATVARVENGDIIFLPASRQVVRGRPVVGAVFETRDLDALRDSLVVGHIVVAAEIDTAEYRSVFLDPKETYGIWLEFRQKR